jgi:iron complex transport system substrate-binding protein
MGYRVASLLPAATEIVCVVGAEADLVGISHECDFPDSVRGLPALTRARVHPVATSRAIDREVRRVLQDALAVYEIELARLEAARPDVIVTQDLCDVCAVSFDDVCAAAAKLVDRRIRIVNLHPTRFGDVWSDIERVAEVLGRAAEGGEVIRRLQGRASEIAARSAAPDARPRVVSIEWIEPVMIGGVWIPELIEMAGGTALVTRPGEHAPTLAMDALRALSPDVVVVSPCGFPLARTLEELHELRGALPWESWPAVRAGRVYIADGNAYFNRPGPRIIESLEILAACLHPDAFPEFRRKHGSAVIRVDAELKQQSL